jgi:hypothetical protein
MPYKIQKKGDQHCVVVSAGPKKGKEVACHATKAKAVKQVRALYANDAAYFASDVAVRGGHTVPCYDEECERAFSLPSMMLAHADRVHVGEKTIERAEALLTFDDTRKIVHEFIREKFGRTGDYKATPIIPSIWTWIEDMASDWVVYTVEEGNETTLFKASYSITDGVVTLGDPVEVRRRTVYEPVKKED